MNNIQRFNQQRSQLKDRLITLLTKKENGKVKDILDIYMNLYLNYFQFLNMNGLGFEENKDIHVLTPAWISIADIDEEIASAFELAINERNTSGMNSMIQFIFSVQKIVFENKHIIIFNSYQNKLKYFSLLLITKGVWEVNREIVGKIISNMNNFISYTLNFTPIKYSQANLENIYSSIYNTYLFYLKNLVEKDENLNTFCFTVSLFKKCGSLNTSEINKFYNFSSILLIQIWIWNLYRLDRIDKNKVIKFTMCIKIDNIIEDEIVLNYIDRMFFSFDFLNIEQWDLKSSEANKIEIDFVEWFTFGITYYLLFFKKLYLSKINKVKLLNEHLNLKPFIEEYSKEIEENFTKYTKDLNIIITKNLFENRRNELISYFEILQNEYENAKYMNNYNSQVSKDVLNYINIEINNEWKEKANLRNIFKYFNQLKFVKTDIANLSEIKLSFEFEKDSELPEFAYSNIIDEFPINKFNELLNEKFLLTLLEQKGEFIAFNIDEDIKNILNKRELAKKITNLIIITESIYEILKLSKYKKSLKLSISDVEVFSENYMDIPIVVLNMNFHQNCIILCDMKKAFEMHQAFYENIQNELQIEIYELKREEAKNRISSNFNKYMLDNIGNHIPYEIALSNLLKKVQVTIFERFKIEILDQSEFDILKKD